MISEARAILKQKAPGLYNVARFLRLKGEKALYKEYIAKHQFGSHELSVVISDRVARAWYDHDVERPSSFDFLYDHRLGKAAKVFVLGAHQAVVSMMLARDVGHEGSIVAVEGNYDNYLVGTRNLQLNNIENVTLLHAAVGATNGQILFSQTHNGMVELSGHNPSSRQVSEVNVDSLAKRFGKPDVIMLDIEGYEAHALEGAVQTLKSKCDWYVEVHGNAQLGRYGKTNMHVIDFFERDFDLFFSPDDISPFIPAASFGKVPEVRFFLLAIARH
jgi:FkbM family methyltransferase